MNYSKPLLYFVVTLLIGCTSHTNGPNMGDDFDQQKAAKNRVSLGLTYLKNGNYSQAKFNLDKALEFAPRSADAHFGLAYYYQSVGELKAAENSFQQAMDYEPNNADIANSYGAFLCQQGDYAKAKEYFFKAINSSNYISSAETYENLALCSQSQGLQAEATQYLRNAVNHQPGRSKSLYLLTQSLILEEKWLEAKETLRKYEKVAQVSADTLLLSTQIEQALGNDKIAQGYGDMLLLMYPNSVASNTYKERLSRATNPTIRKSIKTEAKAEIQKQQVVVTPSSVNVETVKDEIVVENTSQVKAVEEQVKQAAESLSNDVSEPPEVTPLTHVVKEGENLYRISLRYNIKMQRLIEWNKLTNASDIFAGKKLRLTAPNTAKEQE